MKNIQNRYVSVSILLIVALTTIGCNGSRNGSLRENLFSGRPTLRGGQSAETVASNNTGTAKIDLDAAKDKASGVALASYASPSTHANTKAKHGQWLKSYDEAVEFSKQTGKPILADFTGGNWCPPCIRLKKEVFDTPQFKAWATENVVLLELDYPRPNRQPEWMKQQNAMLLKRYKIDNYPSVLFLNADGSMIGSQGPMTGGPDRWIAVANNTVHSNRALKNAKMVDASNLDNRN